VQQQDREQGTLASATERERPIVLEHLKRAKKAEFHS
jgi:hypothetical protein